MHDFSVLHVSLPRCLRGECAIGGKHPAFGAHGRTVCNKIMPTLAPKTASHRAVIMVIINLSYCKSVHKQGEGKGLKKTKQTPKQTKTTHAQADWPHHCVLEEGKFKSTLLTITYQAFSCREQHRNKLDH